MRISDWSSDVCSSDLGKAQLSLARLTLVVGSGNGARTIRRTAAHFVEQREIRIAVGQPDDDHPMMEKGRDARQDRGLLSAMLRRGRGEHRRDFADERAAVPKTAGLIEEVAHLRSHSAKPGRDAEDRKSVV